MKSFNLPEFIESVPVLRLFGKNLALNAGIAFVIQDFLIPLYSNYIIDIVIGLVVFGNLYQQLSSLIYNEVSPVVGWSAINASTGRIMGLQMRKILGLF